MKVIFLQTADEDVRWYARYYHSAFPEKRGNARRQMARALSVLAQNPHIGHPFADTELREYAIPRTPFSLIYRVAAKHIEILRLWDGRANPERLKPLRKDARPIDPE